MKVILNPEHKTVVFADENVEQYHFIPDIFLKDYKY